MYHRYSHPQEILDAYIRQGRLSACIRGLWEEYQESLLWEFYLHKVEKGSYDDFRRKTVGPRKGNTGARRPSDDELKAIIEQSRRMAGGFKG